ncbi:SDR family NAD(P)-dependent oxidoreductase [Marinobacter sp. AL4B]|uniref:SDR family NAD(P)-dependent oxidoreductase n=1 Tax=Marinobacter sp. AL4B TaxID=2871173 RepID=UPI001CAA49CF|nr:SDR family oxidoreductase [Marinobacter sp. AL4B]MBZ0333222.1 SDR family oxidoreductase [Marinobacter sp. AL4B]
MSKSVLITGASRGIGLETAKKFLFPDNDYSTIVLFARKSDDFVSAVQWLEEHNAHGKSIVVREVDVGEREALRTAIVSVYQEVGNVDLLVNNAGYTNPVPLQQVDFEDFERTIAVNLYAPFTLVQELLHLGNKFDCIVNIASTAGINGRSGWLTYSASKAAVINMSSVMREELEIYGTRVICISPGRTATALRRVLAPEEDPSTIMQPGHVAEVIEMLSSPVGRFVDSENLVIRQ